MLFQMITSCEGFPAHITGERYLPCVCVRMCRVKVYLNEHFAVIARIWFITSEGAHMLLERVFIYRFVVTNSASVRTNASVNQHVSGKTSLVCKLFPTFCTYMRFLCKLVVVPVQWECLHEGSCCVEHLAQGRNPTETREEFSSILYPSLSCLQVQV